MPRPMGEGEAPPVYRNRLVLTEDMSDDNSLAFIASSKMAELGLHHGDTAMLRGVKRAQTVCVVMNNDTVPPEQIRVNRVTRHNLRARIGDVVSVHLKHNIPAGKIVTLSPIEESPGDLPGCLMGQYLLPYFRGAFRPVCVGNSVVVRGPERPVDFRVTDCDPAPYCVVTPETLIRVSHDAIRRECKDVAAKEIRYSDVGGCSKQLAQIREIIELPLIQPQLFLALGLSPPKGVLLCGPPGVGKTLIARAIACETGASFFSINGPEIISGICGGSEGNLRATFQKAQANAPAVIFFDEIDAIAPKRQSTHSAVDRRVVSQLLTLMDGLAQREQVIVLAATNRPDSIDGALRRYGRFDREINIGLPDEAGRLEILRIVTKSMRLKENVDIEMIAAVTHGHVGADLAALCWEAGSDQLREVLPAIDLNDDGVDAAILNSIGVSQQNFLNALKKSHPCALRETQVEIPSVKWEDVGGLESIKTELQELIQYPIDHPEMFQAFGLSPSMGVLFYGPPGCGKTLLAKAIATECKANFISIKGPQLLTMWFGESEANVRDIFSKARAAAPCILFFDEIESLVRERSGGSSTNYSLERVTTQILTEMDGVCERKDIFVIGATNRPDICDSAILRPGRLDQLIYIPLPDKQSRLQIFHACLRKSPLARDVDLEGMAGALDGFSGADLAEICRRAARHAIRECIQRQQVTHGANRPGSVVSGVLDDVPAEIRQEHFDEAMKTARRSVTDEEVRRYSTFAESSLRGGRDNKFRNVKDYIS